MVRFFESKDGTLNVEVDGLTYYSKYNPIRDVRTFLTPYILDSVNRYILFGLGLGYHAKYLLELDDKDIVIVETDRQLFETFKQVSSVREILKNQRITIVKDLQSLKLDENDQIVILPSWHKTLRDESLKKALQNIVWLRTDEKSSQLLNNNFDENVKRTFKSITKVKNIFFGDTGVLVSAGPSLEKEISFLKKVKGKFFIIAVGSAYRVLLEEDILPDAIVISDPNPIVYKQVEDLEINIPLFITCTVFPEVAKVHTPVTYMAFQKGFLKAEEYVKKHQIDLVEVGGSVATLAFSLLIYMGIKRLIFVGQDLAYGSGKSHAKGSTSNQNFSKEIYSQNFVLSNRGERIPTALSWNRFREFFENQIARNQDVEFINTALDGVAIQGTKYSDSAKISIESKSKIDFTSKLIQPSI